MRVLALSIFGLAACTVTGGIGEPCIVHSDCETGLRCTESQCDEPPPAPQPVTDAGAPASCGDGCPPDRRCTGGVCLLVCPCDAGHYCDESSGVCRPGCAQDTDCGVGAYCEEQVCQEGCREDSHCEAPATCVDEACVLPPDSCLGHGDCRAQQRCRNGRCLDRVDPLEGFIVERRFPASLTEHSVALAGEGPPDFGFGAGLFDLDGDRDLDLFLGTSVAAAFGSSPACIYANESTEGRLAFTPIANECRPSLTNRNSAYGLDLEEDGYHELLVLGRGVAELHRFHPFRSTTDLMALLTEGDARRQCMAGAALFMDLDQDGRGDLLVGCQLDEVDGQAVSKSNIAWRQTVTGDFEPITSSLLLDEEASTLALGVLDLNDDGLLDIVYANDTFGTGEGTRTLPSGEEVPDTDPGAFYLRCAPTEDCEYRQHLFGEGRLAWGFYMGVANLFVEGDAEHLFLSDWGANRLFDLRQQPPLDRAEALGLALRDHEGQLLYGWASLVDDFDRDGQDDLFLTQGMIYDPIGEGFSAHQDVVLLQRQRGFISLSEEAGLSAHNHQDSGHARRPYSSRGAAKADLDHDGFLDLVTVPMEGVIRLHGEVPTTRSVAPRCTLIPRSRVLPTFGHGYAVRYAGEARWRRWDVQGQIRFGLSPWVLVTSPQGHLRMPSGAVLPYDCGDGPGPVVVEEPVWLELHRREDGLFLLLTGDWLVDPVVEVAIEGTRQAHSMVANGPGFLLDSAPETGRAMLRINGRWLGRWIGF